MHIALKCPPELEALLPRPVMAKKGLPDWFRKMPATFEDEVLGGAVQTAKKCPPFIDAMGHGFLIGLPCDVTVRGGVFTWDWELPPTALARHSRAPMSVHPASQLPGAPRRAPQNALVKFNNFWTITLPAGWSILCVHPVNRSDLPFQCLTGLVDADRYHDNFINFVAEWTDPGFEGVLEKGTPVAQCIPVLRQEWALDFGTLSGQDAQKAQDLRAEIDNQSGVYRRAHRVRK